MENIPGEVGQVAGLEWAHPRRYPYPSSSSSYYRLPLRRLQRTVLKTQDKAKLPSRRAYRNLPSHIYFPVEQAKLELSSKNTKIGMLTLFDSHPLPLLPVGRSFGLELLRKLANCRRGRERAFELLLTRLANTTPTSEQRARVGVSNRMKELDDIVLVRILPKVSLVQHACRRGSLS